MDNQSVVSLLFCLVLYLLVGLALVWIVRRPRAAAKPDAAMQEDDIYVEPGTFGERTNYSAIALLDQMDTYLARATETQLDADIEEMQHRGW